MTKGVDEVEHILSGMERCISDEINAMLMEKYTEEEVFVALKDIGPTKASRIDGFPALFFQRC